MDRLDTWPAKGDRAHCQAAASGLEGGIIRIAKPFRSASSRTRSAMHWARPPPSRSAATMATIGGDHRASRRGGQPIGASRAASAQSPNPRSAVIRVHNETWHTSARMATFAKVASHQRLSRPGKSRTTTIQTGRVGDSSLAPGRRRDKRPAATAGSGSPQTPCAGLWSRLSGYRLSSRRSLGSPVSGLDRKEPR